MIYNLVIYLYLLGVAVYSRFNEKVRKMWRGEREAFRILREKVDPNAKYVWFHAASLGEFEQGRPLMERLRQEHPEYKILLTFFSPSGYEVRKNYEGADIICYLPLDTITNARRFLRTVRPVMAFFIKYEFWYNYLHILKHRHIPVYSVSSIFRPEQVKHLPIVETFQQDAQVFVAGSSWPPDEEIFIPYFKKHPEWKMIIAPHVIGEDHLRQIEKLLEGRKVIRYTKAENAQLADADVLIIDCFGLLSSIYHYGEIAYVGGGFGVGIHNVLEAAVWDVPVFFGPNNQKFQEAQGLKAAGGGFDFETAEAFERQMDIFLTDAAKLRASGEQAGQFVQSLAGATEKVLSAVDL